MFVNREQEIKILKERQKSQRAEFLVVYGRRRVGKTELLRQFMKDHLHVYFLADRQSELEQLRNFSAALGQHFADSVIIEQPLRSWDLAFRYFGQKLSGQSKLILILDEFPYLVEANTALPSIIQKYWDSEWQKRKLFLILCGSSVSFMERELLSYKNPLYGRITGQLHLEPFKFSQTAQFFPRLDRYRLFDIYSVFGGMPAYLCQVDPAADIYTNIAEQVLRKDKILFNEVHLVLREQLREPRTYFYILRAIAFGRTQLNEIVQYTGLDRALVAKYLDVLIELGLVERCVPVTEKNPERSRKGRYRIRDNFFRFWFRFVYPHLGLIEAGQTNHVLRVIRRDLGTFQGLIFEEISRELLWEESASGGLPLTLERLGVWWNAEEELDLVGFNEDEKTMLIGECKSGKISKWNFDKLVKASNKLVALTGAKKVYYVLLSKSGFALELEDFASQRSDITLFRLTETGWLKIK